MGLTTTAALSHNHTIIFMAPIWCLGVSSGISSARAAMSKLIPAQDQGKIFSVMMVLEVITDIFSVTALNLVYRNTLFITPSFTYFVMAAIAVAPFVVGL